MGTGYCCFNHCAIQFHLRTMTSNFQETPNNSQQTLNKMFLIPFEIQTNYTEFSLTSLTAEMESNGSWCQYSSSLLSFKSSHIKVKGFMLTCANRGSLVVHSAVPLRFCWLRAQPRGIHFHRVVSVNTSDLYSLSNSANTPTHYIKGLKTKAIHT